MERKYIDGRNVSDAVRKLLDLILEQRDKKVIYFHGWSGFGVTPVLRSILQNLPAMKWRPELCHHRLLYIDWSEWESRRSLQRKIAEELNFDRTTMDMFDKQDEEDDFNGVDQVSRDLIRNVSIMIEKILRERSFIIIFLNGSDKDLDLTSFGVPFFSELVDNIMIWSFKKRFLLTMEYYWTYYETRLKDQLRRYTHLFVSNNQWYLDDLAACIVNDLLREEALCIVARHPCIQGIDITTVTDCFLYEMVLHCGFHSRTEFAWAAHASNYWICDGIITGDRIEEISNALQSEIRWDRDAFLTLSFLDSIIRLINNPETPLLVISENIFYKKKPGRWVLVTCQYFLKERDENLKTIMGKTSSLFVAFGRTQYRLDNTLIGLPASLFKYCSNLSVLVLFRCAFNFATPPFHQCRGLRFLGLDHCLNDLTREEEGYCTDWTFLYSLWVLDLRYTDWNEILTEGKICLMANLTELNIEGLKCWQYISQLETRLLYLQRLRIIKPMQQAKSSVDSSNSFVDKTKLEVLDLSGNNDMKELPTSLSNASRLQALILDGCDVLENVDVPNGLPSSLQSFSFDGYGPALRRTSTIELPPKSSRPGRPSDQDKKDVKTSKISLRGCRQLNSLFLRGLSNLIELDLSGSTLKVLDFSSMMLDVPRLKRLFLLGCEHLRAIKWGSTQLELLCIDTRPGTWTQPSPVHHESCRLQVYAVLEDVRLARSLWTLIDGKIQEKLDVGFDIHVPSSSAVVAIDGGEGIQPRIEATSTDMTERTELRQPRHNRACRYGDVLTMIGDAPTPMEAFPEPPARRLEKHVEITSDGGHILESELHQHRRGVHHCGLAGLITRHAESLHVHDTSISMSMPTGRWDTNLRWCRVERCPSLEATLFPLDEVGFFGHLEVIWASELAMARILWSRGCYFNRLQHLHLRSCTRIQHGLPLRLSFLENLNTIHIVHCGDLRVVFALDEDPYHWDQDLGMMFLSLTTVHLHDLPMLRGICDVTKTFAPKLQAIRIRGCFGLRRLPAVEDSFRTIVPLGVRWPTVEMEKDVWDALEWDGMDARHHPSYYEPPLHSRYYRKRRLLRGSVLR